jgi:4'-phosphopantetheinyl transferase
MPGVTVDIWVGEVDAGVERLLPALSDDERARADRFRHPVSRLSYIAAHALLRHALTARIGVDRRAWRFVAEPSGRPVVAAPDAARHVRFSIAHCSGLAACTVAEGADVGIDVEDAGRPLAIEQTAKYFSTAERSALAVAPQEERTRLFLRFWTLKEAYVKALGSGLSEDALSHVSFEDVGNTPVVPRFSPSWAGASGPWHCEAWTWRSFEVAFCTRAASSDISVRRNVMNLAQLAGD